MGPRKTLHPTERPGWTPKKMGLRELGFYKRDKLASEKAGIRPLTAAQVAAEADPNFTAEVVTKSSLKGFSITAKRDAQNYPGGAYRTFYSGHRTGGAKATVRAAPRTPRGTRSRRTNSNGMGGPPYGFQHRNRSRSDGDVYKYEPPQRKQGPREARRDGSKATLASQRAGIKPYTATQSAIDARDTSWAGGSKAKGLQFNSRAFAKSPTRRKRKSPTEARNWLAKNNSYKPVSDKQLAVVFRNFDEDNNGYITLDEFIRAFKRLQMPLDARQTADVFREIDIDGSGGIDYAEFRAGYRAIDPSMVYIQKAMKMAGVSSRKAGPREMGKSAPLASELRGIKPMKASEAHAGCDPTYGAGKATASSLQGMSPERRTPVR